jgi:hypothetical protein
MARLSVAELEHLDREGWVLARGIIPDRYIHGLAHEIDGVIDAKAASLAAAGKLQDTHPDAGFLTRAALLYEQCPEIMTAVQGGTHAGQAMFELLTCPELLDAMEQVVGPEVVASSIYRLRPKLPFWSQGVVPVHQDGRPRPHPRLRRPLYALSLALIGSTPAAQCNRAPFNLACDA